MNENEIKEIVIERLLALPETHKISIGSKGAFNKQELIKHVTNNDEIGKKIIEIELDFLRSLKEGLFYG